jgi:Ni/Fe-hydrogenase subunit HybB-like protein
VAPKPVTVLATPALSHISRLVFLPANIAVGLIAFATVRLIAQRRLLPRSAPATTQQGVAA